MGLVLLIVLIVLLCSSWPGVVYTHPTYAYGPPSFVGVVLLVLVILLLTGRM